MGAIGKGKSSLGPAHGPTQNRVCTCLYVVIWWGAFQCPHNNSAPLKAFFTHVLSSSPSSSTTHVVMDLELEAA